MILRELLDKVFVFNKICIHESHGDDADLTLLYSGYKHEVPEELKDRKVLLIAGEYNVLNIMVNESEE